MTAKNVNPQDKIMPSAAKQAETTAFESLRATPFTRVHGRPTRCNYKILKEEACAPASEVEDITYSWSKTATDNYGLLANILGANKYDNLTNIATYAIPHKPASYDPNINDVTPMHNPDANGRRMGTHSNLVVRPKRFPVRRRRQPPGCP